RSVSSISRCRCPPPPAPPPSSAQPDSRCPTRPIPCDATSTRSRASSYTSSCRSRVCWRSSRRKPDRWSRRRPRPSTCLATGRNAWRRGSVTSGATTAAEAGTGSRIRRRPRPLSRSRSSCSPMRPLTGSIGCGRATRASSANPGSRSPTAPSGSPSRSTPPGSRSPPSCAHGWSSRSRRRGTTTLASG
ncbi:MAG: hypothetical protein K0S49_2008, partial [Microbacterium sp.]|nr:hypothetical protein [Microbacterium sp.]